MAGWNPFLFPPTLPLRWHFTPFSILQFVEHFLCRDFIILYRSFGAISNTVFFLDGSQIGLNIPLKWIQYLRIHTWPRLERLMLCDPFRLDLLLLSGLSRLLIIFWYFLAFLIFKNKLVIYIQLQNQFGQARYTDDQVEVPLVIINRREYHVWNGS